MDTSASIAVFTIASTVVFSFIYFLVPDRLKTNKKESKPVKMISLYVWRKASGFLILGGIPAVMMWLIFKMNPILTGFSIGNSLNIWPWIAGASVLLIILNLVNSKSRDLQSMYPEMRIKDWGPGSLMIAAGGWLLYLTGYEFLFRGLLLFSCFNAFGLWPAVVINLALYSTLHLPKGMREAIAAIPFGALLCYLTLESNSILPAIFLHSLQSISCEISCIYRNPEMRFSHSNFERP
jgi:membrane protease YdiL (CAAX protease family)